MDKRRTRAYCRLFVARANTNLSGAARPKLRFGWSEAGRFAPTVYLLLFYFLISSFFVFASEAETALAGMQRRYASVQTISGSFRLSYSDQSIEQVETGVFWLKKPAFMRWEYRHPEEKLFIADGRETYFYVPGDRQVTVQSFTAEELLSTPLKFLLGAEDIGDSFFIEPELAPDKVSEGTQFVRLIPKSETDYAFLVLEIDKTSHDLRRLTIREHSGDVLEYTFTDLKTDVKVSNKMFRFKIPEDAEVHRMENYE